MFKVKKIPQLLKGNFFLCVRFHDVAKTSFRRVNTRRKTNYKEKKKKETDRQTERQTARNTCSDSIDDQNCF